MTMTKEAIQYLMEQGIKPEDRLVNFDEGERWLVFDNDGKVKEILPRVFNANEAIRLNTLSGLVNYIKANIERIDSQLILHVEDERSIRLTGTLEIDGSREVLATAGAIVPRFNFGDWYDMESFNIALQSKFVDKRTNEHEMDDRAILLKVVGNTQEENVKTTGDNGVSQAITIKQGVTSIDALVPNPVVLAPYRTFLEVEQPSSQFVFRMKDGPKAAIFEADGGAWRNQAIVNIHEYLKNILREEISEKRLTILA